ncbi:MAG: alkaline phosphatase family protein [Anaerolineales bacterium]|nr:alkaline phosphatase family protein [Anaerolineales bacterium]
MSLSVFWMPTQGKEIEGSEWRAGSSPYQLSTSPLQPVLFQAIVAPPLPTEQSTFLQVPPSPTATATPSATPTLPPTATPPATPTSPPPTNVPIIVEAAAPTARPESKIEHVVIISVDGMGSDVFAAAEAPNMDKLVAGGAFSAQAQTVNMSETLPSHASMVSGMIPEKHGILWGVPYIGWPGMNGPTLFSVAHDAGLSTAMVFGKQKMNYLILPNSVDTCFCTDAHDPEIKDQAVKIIQAGLPNVLFIHFPDTDRVGHAFGWGSQNQLYAVNFADGLIGEIVTALKDGGYLNSTLLIVTADHGGHDKRHGDDSPVDRTIPWLAVGPKVRSGVTLGSAINTYDTAATVLYAFGLPIPEGWDGQPILEIFQ